MTTPNTLLALTSGIALASATAASAQESARFTYELEVEIGINSVISSDDPTAEITDTYLSAAAAFGYQLTDSTSAFVGFTLESVLDPAADRTFGDLGLYIDSIGLDFEVGSGTITVGKFAPAFGIAWDAAPGYYGADFAGDYELGEAIGISGSFELGAGTLTASAFFLDNTGLSRSIGTDRGRTTTADGGIGNTGKLNNFALQYDVEAGNTSYHLGASFLKRGIGDTHDQKGLAIGAVHALNDDIEIMGEIAAFNGFGGVDDTALYGTIGATLARGQWSFSASYTGRDISSVGVDHLFALGADYTLANDMSITAGLGFLKEASGVNSTALAVALVIPLGG